MSHNPRPNSDRRQSQHMTCDSGAFTARGSAASSHHLLSPGLLAARRVASLPALRVLALLIHKLLGSLRLSVCFTTSFVASASLDPPNQPTDTLSRKRISSSNDSPRVLVTHSLPGNDVSAWVALYKHVYALKLSAQSDRSCNHESQLRTHQITCKANCQVGT